MVVALTQPTPTMVGAPKVPTSEFICVSGLGNRFEQRYGYIKQGAINAPSGVGFNVRPPVLNHRQVVGSVGPSGSRVVRAGAAPPARTNEKTPAHGQPGMEFREMPSPFSFRGCADPSKGLRGHPLRPYQHGGAARREHGLESQLAPAAVARAVGEFRMRSPGHPAPGPDRTVDLTGINKEHEYRYTICENKFPNNTWVSEMDRALREWTISVVWTLTDGENIIRLEDQGNSRTCPTLAGVPDPNDPMKKIYDIP